MGSGLELVAYNTEGVAQNGGYGIYADSGCRDYLYGTSLISAEEGAIISNNGSITMGSTNDAKSTVTEDGNDALSELSGEEAESEERSLVIARRNDFQLHSPDMMGEGDTPSEIPNDKTGQDGPGEMPEGGPSEMGEGSPGRNKNGGPGGGMKLFHCFIS